MRNKLMMLETYDGTAITAEAADGDDTQDPRPLESGYQEERRASPQIMVDLIKLRLANSNNPNRFDRDRLFGAIVRGNPEELKGLEDYLLEVNKFLTNSEYTEGKTGKTCLMKALLNLKDGTNPSIPLLLKIDKATDNPNPLINVQCRNYYKGHTALHIAIEKRNLDLVMFLVENGADVHAKACGKFFQPLKEGVCFYFGELPLSLAACTNQPDVVEYLLHNPHQKCNLTERDSLGNTVLHALVMVATDTEKNTDLVVEMYNRILIEGTQVNPTWKLEEVVNKEGLTPLKLAAQTGKVEIFKHILHREIQDPEFRHFSRKFTEWTYGPVHISLYDLSSVDSWEPNSVLDILAYSNDTPNRSKMVVMEPLNKLLECKWNSYAARRFYLSFFAYLVFMAVFSAVAYLRPLDGETPFPVTNDTGDILKVVGQVVVFIGGLYLFFAQSLYLWRRRLSWSSLMMDSCLDLLVFVQSILLLISAITYLAGAEVYVSFMTFSLLLGWVNMLYYTRGFQQTGIYMVMIQKVLRDLVHFLMVYVIFLFGFATALVVLTATAPRPAQNHTAPSDEESKCSVKYSGLLKTTLELFTFSIGMGDLEFREHVRFKYLVMLLLLLFVILTYVLLLNMLIALMSETVTHVSGRSKSVWKLQRAIAILEIEKNRLWWWWKKPRRVGCFLSVGSENKKDERWFLRVEEVNWANWKKEVGVLKEDPADCLAIKPQEQSLWSRLSSHTKAPSSMPEEEIPLRNI